MAKRKPTRIKVQKGTPEEFRRLPTRYIKERKPKYPFPALEEIYWFFFVPKKAPSYMASLITYWHKAYKGERKFKCMRDHRIVCAECGAKDLASHLKQGTCPLCKSDAIEYKTRGTKVWRVQ